MDKKGIDERQVLWLFYLTVNVVILLAMMAFVNSSVKKVGLDESYYARDLAYTLDLVYAASHDVEFIYYIDDNIFDFFIGKVDDKQRVVVGKKLSDNGYGNEARTYRYNSQEDFGLFEKPERLLIAKKNGKVSINGKVASIILRMGEYISNSVSMDKYGGYRWVIDEIRDDGIIVRKRYEGASNSEDAARLAGDINRITRKYDNLIQAASLKYNIDRNLIKAVIFKESSGNPDARSSQGAVGLMQIKVDTASEMAGRQVTEDELKQPELNIDLGAKYLKTLIGLFSYEELALAAYNYGQGNIRNNCELTFNTCKNLPGETEEYVALVTQYWNYLDINDGRFVAGREGEAVHVKIGSIERLDEQQYAKLIDISQDAANVEVS